MIEISKYSITYEGNYSTIPFKLHIYMDNNYEVDWESSPDNLVKEKKKDLDAIEDEILHFYLDSPFAMEEMEEENE